jgi:hypothetical protein
MQVIKNLHRFHITVEIMRRLLSNRRLVGFFIFFRASTTLRGGEVVAMSGLKG